MNVPNTGLFKNALVKTKKSIMGICEKFAAELTQTAKKNGDRVSIDDISTIAQKYLPKKSNTTFTDNIDEAIDFLRKTNGINEKSIEQMRSQAGAFVCQNPVNRKILYYIPVEKYAGADLANVVTHEFEHLMYRLSSLKNKQNSFMMRTFGEKLLKKELSQELTEKYLDLQIGHVLPNAKIFEPLSAKMLPHANNIEGLINHAGNKPMHIQNTNLSYIRSNIIDPAKPKQTKILKELKRTFSDEARAYFAGGNAAKNYIGSVEGSNHSQMAAVAYESCAEALNDAIAAERVKSFKNLFRQKTFPPCEVEKASVRRYKDARDLYRLSTLKAKYNALKKSLGLKFSDVPVEIEVRHGRHSSRADIIRNKEDLNQLKAKTNALLEEANAHAATGEKKYKLL